MMDLTLIRDLPRRVGEEVTLAGWVYNFRSSGKVVFVQLRDGTGRVQVVCSLADVGEEAFARLRQLSIESSIRITGAVVRDDRAPSGVEVHARVARVLSLAEEYPLQKKEHGVDFLLANRHLWLRSPRQEAIMRVRATVERAIADYFDGLGFIRLDAPILTPAAAEGSSTLFDVDYFGEKAYLSQSGQLYMEAGAYALGRVYCAGPTFRAEKSKTRRHVMEFWMVEPEAAFLDHDGNVALAEGLLAAVIGRVLADRRPELAVLERDPAPLEAVRTPFPRLSYREAWERLRARGFDLAWGDGFGGDEETALTDGQDQPLVVESFPREAKAFYMKRREDDPSLTYSMDILAPEGYGEIIGGSCREDNLAFLRENMAAQGVPPAPLEWYLDLRRYGAVPTAGFGLGVGRTVMWLCGLKHIREALPFPRLLNRIYP